MKKYLVAFCIPLAFISCNQAGKTKTETVNKPVKSEVLTPSALLGSYVGAFGDNKITLLITKIFGDSVEGNSIVAGNSRPFTGIINEINGVSNIVAKEPGNDIHDGVFNIIFDKKSPNAISGAWKPNVDPANSGEKKFSLSRNAFKYITDVGIFPEASKRLLADVDVENLGKDDLSQMRNEIFARHGYCFKRKEIRKLFEDKDWYVPNSVDVKNDLTEIEKQNITKIQKYEKYAAEYGDDYGR